MSHAENEAMMVGAGILVITVGSAAVAWFFFRPAAAQVHFTVPYADTPLPNNVQVTCLIDGIPREFPPDGLLNITSGTHSFRLDIVVNIVIGSEMLQITGLVEGNFVAEDYKLTEVTITEVTTSMDWSYTTSPPV